MSATEKPKTVHYPEPIHDQDASGFSTGYAHALSVAPEPAVPEFAQGSILRVILRMGLPSLIGFLAMNVYDLANMFWVSRLGSQYVAAIVLFESFYWVLIFTNEIAGLGSVAMISRRYGEGDFARAAAAIKETFILKWICAAISGSLGWVLLRPLLKLMGGSPEVIELSVQFGRVHLIGMGIYFASYTAFTSLRCIEAPKTAMAVMLLGSLLNLGLDPLFIFGIGPFPKYGIAGAAVASVICYAITFIVALWLFFSGRTPIRLRWRGETPVSLKNMWAMMKIGLPGGVNTISFSLSRAMIMPLVAIFGTEVVAAYGVGLRVTQFGILMIWGLGIGISPLVGNLVGAGLLTRVRQTARLSMLLAVGIMTAVGLVIFFGATSIAQAFFQEAAIIAITVELLRVYALALPAIGLWIVCESLFHGTGDNVPPMVISIVTSWAIEVPLILLLTRGLGYDQSAVWWIRVVYASLGAMIALWIVKRGKWMRKKV